MKEKKVKIPKSVLKLRMSEKKFAKEYNIKIKGKDLSKKERKYNLKRLRKEYAEFAIKGLDKAVQILAIKSNCKKADKIKEGIENIITNSEIMDKIIKLYKKDSSEYPNLIFLPNMIMNTLIYYNSDDISDDEKKIGESLDKEKLVSFCEKILKKVIKKYRDEGFDDETSFQLATVVPTNKVLTNRRWYKKLINQLYEISEKTSIKIDDVIDAISKLEKKKIKKKDIYAGLYREFIVQKSSNRQAKFNERQKELHEDLIEHTLNFMNEMKSSKLKEMLKEYIKYRKQAEEYKNDTTRVIKFTDHANSNSPFNNIKDVVKELIEDNSSNELYLS